MQDLRSEYAGSEPGRQMQRLRDGASQTLRGATAKATAAYDRTADQATRAYYGARGYARNNPGVTAAATFAAGLGFGMLIGNRTAARAHRRGLVPAVAFVLAQAARDAFHRLR